MQLVMDEMDSVMRFLDRVAAERANDRRRELLDALGDRAEHAFCGTKPHLGPLSPGCERCGRGEWSCLFVSGLCNADCFFCPTDMDVADAPAFAEHVAFGSPEVYADYVADLGFRGVSFSGGEPFLDVDALVAYVAAVRQRLGDDGYLWVYSNGKAVSRQALARVAAAGLDEVRFNIVATDYALDAVRAAVGVVPRVTVEIPAIPEDLERLRALLPELVAAGLDHLNLHQLMIVGQNAMRLRAHDYTFARGPLPGVVDSELMALELMAWAADQGLGLAINYCGLTFKGHVQSKTEDRRAASVAHEPYEALTPSGFTRRLWVAVADLDVAALAASFEGAGLASSAWHLDSDSGRLLLHPSLLAHLPAAVTVWAAWFKTVIGHADPSGAALSGHDYREVPLPAGFTLGVRLMPLSHPVALSLAQAIDLVDGRVPVTLEGFEIVPPGLADYA